ncbi:MAG: hypothetical protein IJS97_07955 [Prevotella sp.]|nr:hypothetical protein [Prevotella sp.]
MLNIRHHLASLLACLPLFSTAQVTDRIVLGNSESEAEHGLITYCPDQTATIANGLQGQSGRYVKPFAANPFCGDYAGIYGGEYSFVLRVDGTKQNYLTLRTNGGDATLASERYHIQIDNKNLQDYTRDAVAFSKEKAPGAFSYSTLVIPRAVTNGKSAVVVRVRSLGRFWGYAEIGNFARYQYTVDNDLPPIYAVYSSTNPNVELSDEVQGRLASYSEAPAKGTAETLQAMKTRVQNALAEAIKGEVNGSDFKAAYQNNNFNVVQCMGYAYQRGVYGTTASALSAKIRVAIDSMVYINNLIKNGGNVSVSAKGQTATLQSAGSGWGGLFGGQGMGMYLIWRLGKVTDTFLNQEVDLGNGVKSRREQWIEAFRESFDAGLTLTGRRYITNQLMESAHSVYGAALALYALDQQTYHNAPKLGLRLMREAVGIDEWTGVPSNARFNDGLKDAEGYPDYQLGDPESTNTKLNYWGKHFHATTACGNGREQGYTCTSCYGNLGGRICDMYIATLYDPFIGTEAGGEGDKDLLNAALTNTKWQSHFTYPTVDSKGYRGIIGESSVCWRNRYDPGKNFYGSLIAGALAGDEEVLGHILQAYKEGHYDPDTTGKLFAYESHSYWLTEAIDKLIAYAAVHDSDYQPMPSTDGQPDYAVGDPQDGVVAVKHGSTHLFVNFLSNDCPLWSGAAHIITPTGTKSIQFAADVRRQYNSGQTVTMPDSYWNGNHKITYPDKPQMAYGGMTYDRPAYNTSGDYNTARTTSQYYQQLIGQYLVVQNCSEQTTYPLSLSDELKDKEALDLTTGETVTLTTGIRLEPQTTKVYYVASANGSQTLAEHEQTGADASALQARVQELVKFAQDASKKLSDDNSLQTYARTAFMPFFRELTMAAFVAQSGTATAEEIAAEQAALEQAYTTFVKTYSTYNACQVPGTLDYTKKVSVTGTVSTPLKTWMTNAKTGTEVFVPVVAAEKGFYKATVKARSYVADSYGSTLNLDQLTDQQYLDGLTPLNAGRSQAIAYSASVYAPYTWGIELDANTPVILRYAFGGTEGSLSVQLQATEVEPIDTTEMLQLEKAVAERLLAHYADDANIADADREPLSSAISQAAAALETDNIQQQLDAYHQLKSAEAAFNKLLLVWQKPTEAHYNAALAVVEDGNYRIYAETDGQRYYLKAVTPTAAESNGAQFTTNVSEASEFTIAQTNVSGVVSRSWKITSGKKYGGKLVYFTNPSMSGSNINNQGYLRVHNRGNRFDYDSQVLYYNGSAYAVRATSHEAGSWGEASFWRVLTNGKVGYMMDPAFYWHFENADIPSGISTMHNAQCLMHNEVYDLQGRKVSHLDARTSTLASLPKGIYIIGGRKVVIK